MAECGYSIEFNNNPDSKDIPGPTQRIITGSWTLVYMFTYSLLFQAIILL